MLDSEQEEQTLDTAGDPEMEEPEAVDTPETESAETVEEEPSAQLVEQDALEPAGDEMADTVPEASDSSALEMSAETDQLSDSESPLPGAEDIETPVEEAETQLEPGDEGAAELESQEDQPSPVEESEPQISAGESGDLDLADQDQAEQEEMEQDGRSWYVVHCYSGYENKVRHNLEQRIETMGMKDRIFDIVVPTEEEIEVKEGKRRTVERRVFPGYILVNMVMTEESWYVVRNTPGVTGFVGMGNTPTPLRPEEVSQIIKRMEAEAPRIKVTFKKDERVRIVDGPFNDFRGTVAEIDMERAKVRVMVNFFGRETPVELDFLQVEKT